jgi:homoserine dehydrogenase
MRILFEGELRMGKPAIKVGILGFGTVGSGVAKILWEEGDDINQKLDKKLELVKIADKDLTRERDIKIPSELMTDDTGEILKDSEIDIIVEVIGGVNPAEKFIKQALKAKKHVVTANKEVMAKHGAELLDLAAENGVDLYFEASVAGAIPVIRSLKESLTGDKIKKVMGIINGTTNYILTKMTKKGTAFSEALVEAKRKGYAEVDPTADIEGYDAAYKLSILSSIAFGSRIDINDVYLEGITKITQKDIMYAKKLGYVIKLLAIGKEIDGEIEARVHPTMIPEDHPLAAVDDVFNAVFIESEAAGELMYYGRGAGSMPTASAVVADVIDITRNLSYKANGRIACSCYNNKELKPMAEIPSKFYLRLEIADKPGVLAAITSILGENNVSIKSVVQKERNKVTVILVLISHEIVEKDIQRALEKIKELKAVEEIANSIRVED